jgi:hypothetical protein
MEDNDLGLVVLGLAHGVAKDVRCLGTEIGGVEDGFEFRDHDRDSCLA